MVVDVHARYRAWSRLRDTERWVTLEGAFTPDPVAFPALSREVLAGADVVDVPGFLRNPGTGQSGRAVARLCYADDRWVVGQWLVLPEWAGPPPPQYTDEYDWEYF